MMIGRDTTIALLQHCGARNDRIEEWAEQFDKTCSRWNIMTPRRRALFLANGFVETGNLSALVEGMNYSVDGLKKTFGRHRISAADAERFGRTAGQPARQADIANCVYGGEWGLENLGNTQPNDGWYFKGRGFFQLTGRANYKAHSKLLGLPITALPDRLETINGALDSAGHFWDAKGIGPLADREDLEEARRRINGNPKDKIDDIHKLYQRAKLFMQPVE